MLRSVYKQLDPKVSGQPIGPMLNFKHLQDGGRWIIPKRR